MRRPLKDKGSIGEDTREKRTFRQDKERDC